MALRPVTFDIPQRRPSIIEQAFGVALGELAGNLVRGPFERRRAREASALATQQSLDIERGRADLALENFPRQEAARREEMIRSGALRPITPSLLRELRAAGDVMPPLTFHNGVEYVEAARLAAAGEANAPVGPDTQTFVDRVRASVLRQPLQRGAPTFAPARVTEDLTPGVTTRREFEEMRPALTTAENVYSAELNAATQRELAAAQRDATRVQREAMLAGQIEDLDAADFAFFAGKGVTRNGRLEPLTPSEMRAYKNRERLRVLSTAQNISPEMRSVFQSMLGQANEIENLGFTQMQVFGREEFSEEVGRLRALPGRDRTEILGGWALNLAQRGVIRNSEGRLLAGAEVPDLIDIMVTRPGLLEAQRMALQYPDAQGYLDALRVGGVGAARLSAEGLGYLQRIYKSQYPLRSPEAWTLPGAIDPAEFSGDPLTNSAAPQRQRSSLPAPVPGAGAFAQPGLAAGGQSGAQSVTGAGGGRADTSALRRGAGRAAPQVENSAQGYRQVFDRAFAEFDRNLAAYSTRRTQIDSVMSTPERLADHLRSLGATDSDLGELITGTPQERRAAMEREKAEVIAALNDARDAVLARRPRR